MGRSFLRRITTEIEPEGNCEIAYQMEYWVAAGSEENSWRPARFTRSFQVTIKNNLPSKATVRVRRVPCAGEDESWPDQEIRADRELRLCSAADISPDKTVYSYILLPVETPKKAPGTDARLPAKPADRDDESLTSSG